MRRFAISLNCCDSDSEMKRIDISQECRDSDSEVNHSFIALATSRYLPHSNTASEFAVWFGSSPVPVRLPKITPCPRVRHSRRLHAEFTRLRGGPFLVTPSGMGKIKAHSKKYKVIAGSLSIAVVSALVNPAHAQLRAAGPAVAAKPVPTSASPAVAAKPVASAAAPTAPVVLKGDVLSIDATDEIIAKARRSELKNLHSLVFGKDAVQQISDDEALKNMQTLMAKREFSSWFRFSDEVSRGLNTAAPNLDAVVKPVASAQEGYMAKLMMIRQAKYTIDATYYIFTLDEAGLALINEMRAAVRRGVNVRILVDSLGSISATMKGNPHFRALLKDAESNAGYVTNPQTGQKTNIRAKVEILVFNPVTNLMAWFRSRGVELMNFVNKLKAKNPEDYKPLATTHWNPNRRTHDKILITDAQFPELSIGIIGGRNISNHYYELDPKDHANFRDIEVIIRNDPSIARTMSRNKSVGEALGQQFDRLYFHRANRRVVVGALGYIFNQKKETDKLNDATVKVSEVTEKSMQALNEDFKSPDFGKNYLNTGFSNESVSFVNSSENLTRTMQKLALSVQDSVTRQEFEKIISDASKLENQQSLLSKIVVLAAAEKKSITVVSPYLWLSQKDVGFIRDWLSKDSSRRFTVITNSIVTSDNMPAQTLVDVATIPTLMEDPRFRSQIQVYEYGRIDDVDLGGTKTYGKLHFKGAYFESIETSLVATYNKDPRSQVLNSESGAVIEGAAYSRTMEQEIADLKANAHEWGTKEYHDIRNSPRLSKMKKAIIKHQPTLYKLMQKLHLWWLI